MNISSRTFAIRITVSAAAFFAAACFAQESDAPAGERGNGLQRTADLVNLMRAVFAPDQAPVLVSPAERAVAEKQASQGASPVVTTAPVVIMPDIVVPESDAGEPDEADTDTDDPPQPVATASRKQDSGEADPDTYPPFRYAFFFGEYVPYYEGWFYYSDGWIWGRRGVIPLDPPGWIPPPRPLDPGFPFPGIGPEPRPGTAGNGGGSSSGTTGHAAASSSAQRTVRTNEPGNTIPVVPDRHRVPRKVETGIDFPAKNSNIPIAAGQHRLPRENNTQIDFPAKNDSIPIAPSSHRIPAKANNQNLFPSKNEQIPVAPGAHRIPRKKDR